MGVDPASLAIMGGAALAGGMMGQSAARKNAKAAQKADLMQFWENYNNRQKVKDQYKDTRNSWKNYSPDYIKGGEWEGDVARGIQDSGSTWQNYIQGAGTNSLGLGYRKATESIIPELYGQSMPVIENLQEQVLPYARSAAIDQGAYGGARDMLTRERLTEDAEDTIISQGLQDLQNQRAQTPALLGADTESLNRYLNASLAPAQTLMQSAQDRQYGDQGYLWDVAQQFGNQMGTAKNVPIYSRINPSAYGTQGFLNGFGGTLSAIAGIGGQNGFGFWGPGSNSNLPLKDVTNTAGTGGNVRFTNAKYMG